jgi:hypothetical protein
VVFGTATMNSAEAGNGIGNVAVRDEQYPHCKKERMIKMEKEFKYYIILDKEGKRVSPGYREDGDVPEDVKENGFLVTKSEFAMLLNGYYRDPETGEYKEIPPYEPGLDELKASKLLEVYAWTESKITGGFTSECSGEMVRYDSDKDTQLTISSDLNTINSAPDKFSEYYPNGYPMRGYPDGGTEKTIHYLTVKQLIQWNVDLGLHRGACKQAGWEKQALVDAADSKEALDAIILEK